ncbi:MAG TPA: ribonuclease HII [Cytophagaceae bacterium]|jgi:ribonuclease HII|nr:ribonuclease HII [Cytophagaceae bacterium]
MLKSSFSKDKIEAGLDEAGRGCLAGPVVAAAVVLPKDYKHSFLNDSKKISAKQRETLRTEIEKEAISFSVAEISEKEIDEINILNASFKAMHHALDQLKFLPQLLLIDGNRFKKYKAIPHECIVKGDGKFLSIAAASILAKTYRDDLMIKFAQQYPEYGWERNMGYGTEIHRKAIEKYGYSPLHRLTFKLKPKQLELF